MASSSSSYSLNQNTSRYMSCRCGLKMKIFTSWTAKNLGRRFVKCPQAKSGYCTGFTFIDDELPSQYYKDLVFELHSQTTNPAMEKEQDESKVNMVKVMEELAVTKTKLKLTDCVVYVLIGVVAMLSFAIVALVM